MWNNTIKPRLLELAQNVGTQFKINWEEDFCYARSCASFVYQQWVRVERLVVPMRKHAFNLSGVSFVFVVGVYVFFPSIANADPFFELIHPDAETTELLVEAMQNETLAYGVLPVAETAAPRRSFTIPMTAYTSEVAQTDDTPCITASGLDVCERDVENVVAANFLPIGTQVRIPELFGDRVFYVEDRMNARYYYKMDVWMKDYDDAIDFGLQYATIETF
jgi:3D (Asp-Asp-Asp) domain-containing protein